MANLTDKKVLVSSLARFVQGDIKGGASAHAYRKEIIATAVEQAYKGNYSPITEAASLTEGKAKKSRAYAAGFAALGVVGDVDGIKKVHYVGSLNAAENKPAREEIANKTAASVSAFFAAFDIVMAEKGEKKAPKEGAATDAAPASEYSALTEDQKQHVAAVALDDSVAAMENMARTGALTGEQTDRLAVALIEAMTEDQILEIVMYASRRAEKLADMAAREAEALAA